MKSTPKSDQNIIDDGTFDRMMKIDGLDTEYSLHSGKLYLNIIIFFSLLLSLCSVAFDFRKASSNKLEKCMYNNTNSTTTTVYYYTRIQRPCSIHKKKNSGKFGNLRVKCHPKLRLSNDGPTKIQYECVEIISG